MSIQWFPGHMNKARNEVKAIIPKVDLLIEVLDARIPYSSQNPMIGELRGKTPVVKLLAKSDLADPARTKEWIEWHDKQTGIKARAITIENRTKIRSLPGTFYSMVPEKQGNVQSLTAMIAGVPNVGKSTLINILAGRKVAKTGNEPAVTKGQQRINIGEGITLLDTPGMLWPKVENPRSGLRLAAVGSVKDTAMEYEDVAGFVAAYLIEHYPQAMVECFEMSETPAGVIEFLDDLGKRRGCLGRAGVIDYDRVSRIVVNELRQGKIGQITLETPAEIEREVAELVVHLSKKDEAKKAKKAKRKAAFKARNDAKKNSRRRR